MGEFEEGAIFDFLEGLLSKFELIVSFLFFWWDTNSHSFSKPIWPKYSKKLRGEHTLFIIR